ncbi:MAG: hypothetical protein ACD_77C00347G0002 [uncultured bacterium]|nr:MAG: hypothetical protein ACD_77C00347G0002 [uncultured bacterium]
MNKVKDLQEWFLKLEPHVKGYILLIVLLILGIILRWNVIINNIISGFNYFSK